MLSFYLYTEIRIFESRCQWTFYCAMQIQYIPVFRKSLINQIVPPRHTRALTPEPLATPTLDKTHAWLSAWLFDPCLPMLPSWSLKASGINTRLRAWGFKVRWKTGSAGLRLMMIMGSLDCAWMDYGIVVSLIIVRRVRLMLRSFISDAMANGLGSTTFKGRVLTGQ